MARKGKILKSNKRDSSFIREIRVLGQLCTQVIHRSQLFHGTCCLMKVLVATKRFFEKLGLIRVTVTLSPLDLFTLVTVISELQISVHCSTNKRSCAL